MHLGQMVGKSGSVSGSLVRLQGNSFPPPEMNVFCSTFKDVGEVVTMSSPCHTIIPGPWPACGHWIAIGLQMHYEAEICG